MAIVTGELYKGFMFGDISSKAYGVYITQEAAYNAPERDTEVVEIAGRNGAYILDKGRYKNITVSYKCGIALGDEQSFENAIRVFRNALASEAGKYVRLEDEYNPNEYRQAAFLGGIDVDMADRRAGEFTVSFDAKPQRFLKSGETAVTIGGSVTNTQTKSGSVVSLESDGGDAVTSLVAQIEPVQAGSGDPSPTNVRPITGWDEINVLDDPKYGGSVVWNQLFSYIGGGTFNGVTLTMSGGEVNVNGTATGTVYRPNAGTYKSIANHVYFVSQGKANAGISFYNDGKGVSTNYQADNIGKATGEGTFYFRVASGASFNNDVFIPQIFDLTKMFGSSVADQIYVMEQAQAGSGVEWFRNLFPKDYYEYNAGEETCVSAVNGDQYTTIHVPLGQTVYGGTLDVVTGVLTVTHKAESFDGTKSWGRESNGTFYLNLGTANKMVGRKSGGLSSELLANWLKPASSGADNTAWVGTSGTYLNAKCSSASDVAAFKSMLSTNPLVVVYPLATPQTVQLTAHEVELLTGQNHVWADTGDITITWGDPNKLVNPTLYDAHPLLSFTASGAGTININNDTISVTNQPIGDIILANVTKLASGESITWTDTSRYLTGDAIRIDSIPAITTTVILDTYSYVNYTQYSGDDMDYLSTTATARGTMTQHSIPNPPQFVAGTARSVSYQGTVINKVKNKSSGNIVDCTINLTVTIAYDGAHSITATTTVTASLGTASTTVTIDTVTVNSTKSSLTGTAYVDLDIGEAYSIDGGAVVSINDSVSLGASLPVLKPSTNTISKTGAVANLKVTPRWWEL